MSKKENSLTIGEQFRIMKEKMFKTEKPDIQQRHIWGEENPHMWTFFHSYDGVSKWMSEEDFQRREVCYLTISGNMIKVPFKNIEDLKKKMKRIDNESIKGWYITPNPTDGKGRKAENITKREWLVVDIDTVREKNKNATDSELEKAFEVAYEIRCFTLLRDHYSPWQDPLIALSGNGVHLLYRCELENTEEHNNLVKEWYSLLDKRFSTDKAKIDVSMASIAQLTKLYGTTSRKSPESEGRPWRQTCLKRYFDEPMTQEYIWYIWGKEEEMKRIINFNKLKEMTENLKVDLEKVAYHFEWLKNWCEEHNFEYRENKTGVMFKNCPFYPDHQQEYCSGVMCDRAVSVDNFVFYCFGEHCRDEQNHQLHTWKELREKVEGIEQRAVSAHNSSLPTPINLTDESIVAEKEYWTTNISSLDEALGGGLARGELSVVTGFPSGGKSTFVQQMVANYIRQGLSVGYYQGDRSQEDVKNNFITIGLTNEELAKVNFYSSLQNITPDQMVEISSKYDVFVFDNFLAYQNKLNATFELSGQLVEQFSSVVKENNNHIMTVAHQSKHTGLANMGQIASSQQIANKADMIVAVERYDEEFARKVYSELGRDSELYNDLFVYKRNNSNPSAFFSIFKNQTGGDLKRIPILFEKEKKLFKNYEN